jgi:O-antigen ligase
MIFIWLFKEVLGPRRVMGIIVGGAVLMFLTGALAVNYTDFGKLFDRLQATEIEEGVPDTRQAVWPSAWKEIKRNPIFGHGPRFRLEGEDTGNRYEGKPYIRYPHNLYLFLTFTIGVMGLIAFMILLFTPLVRCWKTSRLPIDDQYLLSMSRTGVVLVIVILVDQLKISMMRLTFLDYWHFVFALFGMLIAICDRAKAKMQTELEARRANYNLHV